jgi:MFS family permease
MEVPNRRRVVILSATWILGCSFAGLVAAMIDGEFGSLALVGIGLFTGVSGAISHCILIRRFSFRRRSKLAQAVTLWSGASVLPVAWALLGVMNSTRPVAWYYLIYIVGGIAAFALLAAACITLCFDRGRRIAASPT